MRSEHALVQQARGTPPQIVEANEVRSLGHVVGDRLNPRPADRLVVLCGTPAYRAHDDRDADAATQPGIRPSLRRVAVHA
jgi:hypothetical protein